MYYKKLSPVKAISYLHKKILAHNILNKKGSTLSQNESIEPLIILFVVRHKAFMNKTYDES